MIQRQTKGEVGELRQTSQVHGATRETVLLTVKLFGVKLLNTPVMMSPYQNVRVILRLSLSMNTSAVCVFPSVAQSLKIKVLLVSVVVKLRTLG